MLRPRSHLSWTQLDTLERSEEQYRRIYIEGRPIPVNRGMALGRDVATALESGEETGDAVTDLIVAQLPKFELMDNPFKVTIKVGEVEIPLLSKLDTAKADLSAFKEYKTGVTTWDQKKADKHGQITFYCVVCEALTGKVPQDIELVYAPSEYRPDGRVELTGEIKRFKTSRTTADILKMKIRMKKAWIRIGEICDEELF